MLLMAMWCVAVLGLVVVSDKALEFVYFSAVLVGIISVLPLVCMVSVLSFRLLKQSGTFVRGVSWLRQMCTRHSDYESFNDFDDVDIPQILMPGTRLCVQVNYCNNRLYRVGKSEN